MAPRSLRVPVAELSLPQLRQWAGDYAAALQPPAVVALRGDLGAGKTTLVQALLAALGVTGEVTSPTYSLVHEFASARGPVHHLDLYRLRDASQLAQLGWDDILRTKGLVFVEWPERAEDALPPETRTLTLEHVAGRGDVRRLSW